MTAAVPLRRVIVGTADYRFDKSAAQMAAAFARQVGLEMFGLFIDERDLLGLAEIPLARELRSLEGRWRQLDGNGGYAAQRHRCPQTGRAARQPGGPLPGGPPAPLAQRRPRL